MRWEDVHVDAVVAYNLEQGSDHAFLSADLEYIGEDIAQGLHSMEDDELSVEDLPCGFRALRPCVHWDQGSASRRTDWRASACPWLEFSRGCKGEENFSRGSRSLWSRHWQWLSDEGMSRHVTHTILFLSHHTSEVYLQLATGARAKPNSISFP